MARPAREYPFPQADSPQKILHFLNFLCESRQKHDDISLGEVFHVHHRQARMYGDALGFLGLASFSGGYWIPTKLGQEIHKKPEDEAMTSLAGLVFEKSIFAEAVAHLRVLGTPPEQDLVMTWIREENPGLNDTTASRRAKTVISWAEKLSPFFYRDTITAEQSPPSQISLAA